MVVLLESIVQRPEMLLIIPRDTGQHYNKDFSTQNVNSVEVEKLALVRLGVLPGRLLSSLPG